MDDRKKISFVRLDILEFYREFIDFEISGDIKGAGERIIKIAKALSILKKGVDPFADNLITEAEIFQNNRKKAGRLGGMKKAENRAKQNQESSQNRKKPPSTQDLYDFCRAKNLDEADARDWYEQNYVERPGCDKDGVEIKNWKGALIRACEAATKKRERQANGNEVTTK